MTVKPICPQDAVELVEGICDRFDVVPPEVTFDLWSDGFPTAANGHLCYGRYDLAQRLIRFPPNTCLEDLCHEVAHHIMHGDLLIGIDGHGEKHTALTQQCIGIARQLAGE